MRTAGVGEVHHVGGALQVAAVHVVVQREGHVQRTGKVASVKFAQVHETGVGTAINHTQSVRPRCNTAVQVGGAAAHGQVAIGTGAGQINHFQEFVGFAVAQLGVLAGNAVERGDGLQVAVAIDGHVQLFHAAQAGHGADVQRAALRAVASAVEHGVGDDGAYHFFAAHGQGVGEGDVVGHADHQGFTSVHLEFAGSAVFQHKLAIATVGDGDGFSAGDGSQGINDGGFQLCPGVGGLHGVGGQLHGLATHEEVDLAHGDVLQLLGSIGRTQGAFVDVQRHGRGGALVAFQEQGVEVVQEVHTGVGQAHAKGGGSGVGADVFDLDVGAAVVGPPLLNTGHFFSIDGGVADIALGRLLAQVHLLDVFGGGRDGHFVAPVADRTRANQVGLEGVAASATVEHVAGLEGVGQLARAGAVLRHGGLEHVVASGAGQVVGQVGQGEVTSIAAGVADGVCHGLGVSSDAGNHALQGGQAVRGLTQGDGVVLSNLGFVGQLVTGGFELVSGGSFDGDQCLEDDGGVVFTSVFAGLDPILGFGVVFQAQGCQEFVSKFFSSQVRGVQALEGGGVAQSSGQSAEVFVQGDESVGELVQVGCARGSVEHASHQFQDGGAFLHGDRCH